MKKTPKEERPGKKTQPRKDIIASRKACTAEGTGLSHYVLMDGKARAGR